MFLHYRRKILNIPKLHFFYKYYTYKRKRNQCKHLLYKIEKYRDNSWQDRHNIIKYYDIWKYLIITKKKIFWYRKPHGTKTRKRQFWPSVWVPVAWQRLATRGRCMSLDDERVRRVGGAKIHTWVRRTPRSASIWFERHAKQLFLTTWGAPGRRQRGETAGQRMAWHHQYVGRVAGINRHTLTQWISKSIWKWGMKNTQNSHFGPRAEPGLHDNTWQGRENTCRQMMRVWDVSGEWIDVLTLTQRISRSAWRW